MLGGDPNQAAVPPLVDPVRLKRFREAWANHEVWFQNGARDPDQYSWPVPGTQVAARDGHDAYIVYRDAIAEYLLRDEGFGGLLDAIEGLVTSLNMRHPRVLQVVMEESAPQDAAFLSQWQNLFQVSNVWEGLSHADLSLYARKYEVEWPLRLLVHLKDLHTRGTHDASLARFRDKAGSLKKGQMVDYVKTWPKPFRAIGQAVGIGFSPKLRNAIGHNSYTINDGRCRSLDGKVDEDAGQILKRFRSLGGVHNALIWIVSRRHISDKDLRASGVAAVGWARVAADDAPILLVLQLIPFFLLDLSASWVTNVDVTVSADLVLTRVGAAQTADGLFTDEIRDQLRVLAERGTLTVEVRSVVPCLHSDEGQHTVFENGHDRFCEVDYTVRTEVPFTLSGMNRPR